MQASMQLRSAAASKVAGKNAGAIAPVVPVQRVNRYAGMDCGIKSTFSWDLGLLQLVDTCIRVPAPGLAVVTLQTQADSGLYATRL